MGSTLWQPGTVSEPPPPKQDTVSWGKAKKGMFNPEHNKVSQNTNNVKPGKRVPRGRMSSGLRISTNRQWCSKNYFYFHLQHIYSEHMA